jgi:nucleoid DNA-binding protein
MRSPKKLTVKEQIIKKISREKVISQKVIEQVVKHQFDSAHEALKTNNSVEISGFGKFLFNGKKTVHKIKKLEDIKKGYERKLREDDLPEKYATFIKSKLSTLIVSLNSLKPKLEKYNEEASRDL